MDGLRDPGIRKVGSHSSIDTDVFDISRVLDKPRTLNIDRHRSLDERSMSEQSVMGSAKAVDSSESMYSTMETGARLGFETPISLTPRSLEPHPNVVDAWEALRRSLVYFRGQPVGTVAAIDYQSEEILNYDQVCSNPRPAIAANFR
ncbi:hypothetical protein IEQ34_001580 [Dendrobium chrysotoxum]|uniref:Uncharacterized protein n=1 Tax=Dendrobium chrysotoxum TaxID=161865 RepID=A0AAV7HM99_DENCH|nr:hypothetical protein IEQ34_001580 [Dendrobium chrysotoxum]